MRLIFKQQRPAFTLIELLLVMGIMAILATVVIVAINPTKQLGQANDVANQSKARAISNALQQYYVERAVWPGGISTTPQTICSNGYTAVGCLDLADDIANASISGQSFISEIPQAVGFEAPDSGFDVYLDGSSVVVEVRAMSGVSTLVLRDPEPKRAYLFAGDNDYIVTSGTPDLTSPWGFESDLYLNALPASGYKTFFGRLGNGSFNFRVSTAGRIDVSFGGFTDGVNAWRTIPVYTVTPATWFNFKAVWNGTDTLEIFIDNVSIGTKIITAPDFNTGTNIFLGIRHGGSEAWDGKMFNAKLVTGDAEAWHYKMDDTNATIAYDSSGNGNHGTKTNITPATFHYEGSDVPYSWQNTVGFSAFENLARVSSDASPWSKNSTVLTDGQTDVSGGTTAMRLSNADTNHGTHRIFSTGNTISDGDYVVLWFKGTAGTLHGRFTAGSHFFYNVTTSTFTSGTATMVENEAVGDWQKIVVQFADVGSSVFQMAVDSSIGNTYFTPPNTTNYLDFQIQFTSDYTAFDYISTTGAVVTGDYFPRNESNTSQDVLGNPLQYSGPSS